MAIGAMLQLQAPAQKRDAQIQTISIHNEDYSLRCIPYTIMSSRPMVHHL